MIDWLLGGCCGPGGTLVWTTPPTLIALAIVVGLALSVAAFLPGPVTPRRAPELVLWIVAVALLVGIAARPTWIQAGSRTEAGRFVVLVDASRSMNVRDNAGAPRSEAVSRLLARLPEAEVYRFGERLTPGAPTSFDQGNTDLAGALDELARRYAGERLQGVAVLTDGIDRGGLRRRLTSNPQTPLPHVGGPLTLYQVGARGARVDAAVTGLHAGGFAFLRAPFTIEVDVQATGLAQRQLAVTLTRDGQPAGTATATLDEEGRGSVKFTVTPDQVGRFLYEASVPVVSGDAVPANNALNLAVRVVRDRVRILQVCGSPSWDQKFLRLFLKEDPAVDLVSFFILRTMRDMGSGYDGSELSLIGFPYRELFSEQLPTFDLVILQNFDYAPYFEFQPERLLQNLADYVEAGGALVMIGGDRSFDLGRYARTPVASVLPVQLGVTVDGFDTTTFSPEVTAAGRRHPITMLTTDDAENTRMWTQLAELDGLNRTLGPRPGSAVLLEHPTLSGPGNVPLPVLAVGEYGRGRSMAFTADSSWRWSFAEAGSGRGNQAYLRFWKNAMRWLIGDPEDHPVTVEAGRDNYEPGAEASVTVQVRDIAFAPLAGASVAVEVSGPGGRTTVSGATGVDGRVTIAVPASERGAHRVKVRAVAPDGSLAGEAATVFAVTSRDPELDEVDPDSDFLQALAAGLGGRYVGPGDWEEPMRDLEAGRHVSTRTETAVWAMPILPGLVALFAAGSWAIRRQQGRR